MIKMTIGEALRQVKKFKEQIGELVATMNNTAWYYEGSVSTTQEYTALAQRYDVVLESKRKLQVAIMAANLSNTVRYLERDISLSEAILIVDDLRREISTTKTRIKDPSTPDRGRYGFGTRTKDELIPQPAFDPKGSRVALTIMSERLTALDTVLNAKNWKTTISVELPT